MYRAIIYIYINDFIRKNMNWMYFNSNIFSRYRAELMGIATLMIIVCHLPAQGVVMPSVMARIIRSGVIGCDIFLFLSGMGMWFSMASVRSGKMGLGRWYLKRYIRILVPYLIIVIPVCLSNGNSITEVLIRATGFDFFVYRLALWFVSCILLLYILTPLIDRLLASAYKLVWLLLLIVLCITFAYIDLGNGMIQNWQFVVCRFPSYFIGYLLAGYIKADRRFSMLWMIVLPLVFYMVLYVLNHRFGCNFSLFWLQGIPVMTIIVLVLSKLNMGKFNSALAFWGAISLESYSTNVLVLPRMKSWSWSVADIDLNSGNWTFYIIGTVICLIISVIVNRVSKIIINKML